jgi:hypothetical protein
MVNKIVNPPTNFSCRSAEGDGHTLGPDNGARAKRKTQGNRAAWRGSGAAKAVLWAAADSETRLGM